MTTHRREHLESTLLRVLQLAVRDLNDPRMEGLVTITGVEISPDMKVGHTKVSVLPAKFEPKVIAALKHAAGHLRRLAGEEIRTVRIPDLVFVLDTSLKKQAEVMAALYKVALEREAKEAAKLDAAAQVENHPTVKPAGEAGHAEEHAR